MTDQSVKLNAWAKNYESQIAVQGEVNSRTLIITLIDKTANTSYISNAESVDRPIDLTGITARLYCIKPDGTKTFSDGTITDAANGIVSFVLPYQATTSAGTIECQILLTKADNSTLKITGLSLNVQSSNLEGAVESSDDFSSLVVALNSVNTAAALVNQAVTNSETAVNNANVAISGANTAADNANAKATLANTAANTANSAASNADTKTALAVTATTNANTATASANTATTNANTAADRANTAAQNAEGVISGQLDPAIDARLAAQKNQANGLATLDSDGKLVQDAKTLNGYGTDNGSNSVLLSGRKSGTTIGANSTAEGSGTTASGNSSHAEGSATVASGDYSHAEGMYSVAIGQQIRKITAYTGSTITIGDIITGVASAFYPVPKIGDTLIIGRNSSSLPPITTKVTAVNSSVISIDVASDSTWLYAGYNDNGYTSGVSNTSHAEGMACISGGENSHAEGVQTIAANNRSHAEGYNTTANGGSSHAEGSSSIASGNFSHAEGSATQSKGSGSHAEGDTTTASGNNSHAEGNSTNASGVSSHAEGYRSKASNNYSHAEGDNTTASGSTSHAEGTSTTASGTYSHAEGNTTIASGNNSHAEGNSTTANTYESHVIGQYNKVLTGNTAVYSTTADAFVIGNGTGTSALANAFRVTFDGKTYGLSAFNSTGADYSEFFEWLDDNLNSEDRAGRFVTLDGEKIKYANDGDYIVGIVSATPAIVGDNPSESWSNRWITDIFGRIQYHNVDVPEQTETITYPAYTEIVTHDDGFTEEVVHESATETIVVNPAHTELQPMVNPNYDSSKESDYLNREKRPEWDTVGLIGKLVVIDDGTCQVNGYCKPSNGIATASVSGHRVIARLDETHIKVLFR